MSPAQQSSCSDVDPRLRDKGRAMHENERYLGSHFKFGANWEKLVSRLDETRLQSAMRDIADFMGRKDIEGLSFLDIGSGSGLSSLAAYRLGAREIVSVDIDPLNIQNLLALKRKFLVPDQFPWNAYQSSIVDASQAKALPGADIVYSWGVLHHTGAMWEGIDNCSKLVNPGGYLYLMLYREAWLSPVWKFIKKTYTRGGELTQFVLRNAFTSFLILGLLCKFKNPMRVIRDYGNNSRGMSWYLDVIDWVAIPSSLRVLNP